uniref:RIIa domain-containing protein n=1 Tax=Glossina austeni TaxID=7395 RepID=A0A1A9UYW5_GLOAU
MLYLLQRGKLRSQVINVPEGLADVLSDIAREVLRCQPTTECLCQFISDYMNSVIMSRKKAVAAKSIIDSALNAVDEVITDMCLCDVSKEKSEAICAALEECFQRFLAKRRYEQGRRESILKFNEIDLLDELIMKCKFSESELKVSRPIIETAYERFVDIYTAAQQNTESTEALYEYFREREQKRADERGRHTAAVKIQAWYRGSHLRKSMYNDADVVTAQPHVECSESESEEMMLAKEMAARKIQQFFRNRLSSVTRRDSSLKTLEELCEIVSHVSLTMHPYRYVFKKEDEGEDQAIDKTVPSKDALDTSEKIKTSELSDLSKEIVDDDAQNA